MGDFEELTNELYAPHAIMLHNMDLAFTSLVKNVEAIKALSASVRSHSYRVRRFMELDGGITATFRMSAAMADDEERPVSGYVSLNIENDHTTQSEEYGDSCGVHSVFAEIGRDLASFMA